MADSRRQGATRTIPAANLDWLTRDEVAQYLKVHVRTVDRLMKQGRLEARKISHKVVRISASSVEALFK